jgi:Metallo-peptidase family M12
MDKKLDKFEKDTANFKKCHYISEGDIKKLQKNNKLTIHIPSTGKPITFSAKRVQTYNDEDYVWYGEDETDDFTSITLQNKKGLIFGIIKTEDEVSEIYGLSRGESIVLDKQKIRKTFCTSEKIAGEVVESDVPKNNLSVRSSCIGPPKIRVLFVTDNDSRASVPDINQTALNCIESFNNSLSSTNITNQTARLIFAGMLNLSSFEENVNNPTNDLSRIRTLSLTERMNTAADIVVFLTASTYISQVNFEQLLGISMKVEANSNTAFAIVKADMATSDRFVFNHEVGHLFGGMHRIPPGGTVPSGLFAFGNCIYAGPHFLAMRNYQTVMSSNCLVTVTDKFSSPNASIFGTPTGTATADVARKIDERASTVGDFMPDMGALSLTLSGNTNLQPFQTHTFTALPQCESGNVSFNWEVSINGFNYYNVASGVGVSSYTFFYNPYTFTNTVIRVTITDGLGRTATSFAFLQLNIPPMYKRGSNTGQSSVSNTKIEAIAYPNPANVDDLFIEFKLKENSKEISIELVNNE